MTHSQSSQIMIAYLLTFTVKCSRSLMTICYVKGNSFIIIKNSTGQSAFFNHCMAHTESISRMRLWQSRFTSCKYDNHDSHFVVALIDNSLIVACNETYFWSTRATIARRRSQHHQRLLSHWSLSHRRPPTTQGCCLTDFMAKATTQRQIHTSALDTSCVQRLSTEELICLQRLDRIVEMSSWCRNTSLCWQHRLQHTHTHNDYRTSITKNYNYS